MSEQASRSGAAEDALRAPSISAALEGNTPQAAALREAWRKSPESARVLKARIAGAALCAGALALALAIPQIRVPEAMAPVSGPFARAAVTVIPLAYVVVFALNVYRRQQRRAWFDREVLLAAKEQIQGAEADASSDEDVLGLSMLWSLTQKRLDYYHGLATSQAERSFNYGLATAGVGFFILVGGMVTAAVSKSVAASVAAGVVGVGGGGLAAYLGATFMKLQETSASHLRAYFEQPLEFSRMLAAERLLSQLEPGDRTGATRDIIVAITRSAGAGSAPDGPTAVSAP